MKDIKVELVDVEDESVYNKPDYTVLIGMIVMVTVCATIGTVTNVLSVMY